jgi:transketolase
MSISPELITSLEDTARRLRIDILTMTHHAKSGHVAGPLSCLDLMVALYFHHMRHDVKKPDWEDRDRLILGMGHVVPAQYACLAEAGYFPREELKTLRQLGSRLQGHPKMDVSIGLEMSTGSLGHSCSIANGLALSAKLNKKDFNVYTFNSDGEAQEGMFWEGLMTAAHYKLDNRCSLMDYNGIQIDGFNADIMNVAPFTDKIRAFNWHVIEIDGHDYVEILEALAEANATQGKPTMIMAKTLAGKGVPFIEGDPAYHGKPLNDEELARALAILEKA